MTASFLALVWWTCVLMCKTEDGTLSISAKFNDGDVTFMWNGTASNYTVSVHKDGDGGNTFNVNVTQYTIKNAILHDKITFDVKLKTRRVWDPKNRKTYQVSKIKAKVGDSVNMSWTAPFFPKSEAYTIYHTSSVNVNRSIITVTAKDASVTESKYNYTSRPLISTNISFKIRDITLQDAGYYAGGGTSEAAWSGGGVVLIVLGKPKINGNLSIPVGITSELTCSSNLSLAPDYYAKLVKMTYTWFENDRMLDGYTGQNLRLMVTKNHRYNRYTCTARDNELESDRSEPVQMNPLYKPDNVTITPQPPPNDRLTVTEGETIGPYNCSADCNPPCSITWKRKDTDDNVTALTLGKTELSQQIVNRNMSLFRCVAKYDENNKIKYNIPLNIQYLDKPIVFINELRDPSRTIEIRDSETLSLSCFVDSNPDPNIELFKISKETRVTSIAQKKSVKWLNHTIASLQCSESGTYTCSGVSKGLNSTETTFGITVLCKTRVNESTIKSIYGSKSGHDVKVSVAVPVIANPAPQESNITWSGPTGDLLIKSTVTQQDVSYKHWINSSIPIIDQNYFGNYTLKYNGDEIFVVNIIAEDVPQKPLNFTGYSYTSGYINLTWISGFNGGQQQRFILSKKDDSEWMEIANVSDPGEGRLVHFDPGRLNIGREYMFRLKSCNAINCSKESVDIKVSVKEPKQNILLDKKFIVGAAGAIIIFILTIALLLYCLKRRVTKKRQRNIHVEVEDNDQPDVVLYAAVDKSAVKNNQSKADVVEDIPEKTDGNETLYATVEKGSKTEPNTIPDKKAEEEKKESTNKKREGVTSAEASENTASRNVNQDGLIYIDVEFAKKSDNTDTNAKPKIHGEEDRTEYTFVDFSKKAPVVKEKPRKEEGK